MTNLKVSFKGSPEPTSDVVLEAEEAEEAARNYEVLQQFWSSRTSFGLARIKMGAYLHLIKQHKLWRGVSESWDAFIARENVNPNAARQYMTVAKKFVFEMDLPEETLAKLSLAGITALERAANTMSEHNQEEVVTILSELTERDAIQRLLEMSDKEEQKANKPTLRVLRLLKEYHEMPPDLQAEFKGKIMKTESKKEKEKLSDDEYLHKKYQGR